MPELTSEATGTGGRTGTVSSKSGSYTHQMVMPGASTPGVTPEELIAGAWAACYGTTLTAIAAARHIDASRATVVARITLDSNHEAGEYTISRAELRVGLEGQENDQLDQIIEEAHGACPVSKLISGGARDVQVKRITGSD